jgi:hypothetical protein
MKTPCLYRCAICGAASATPDQLAGHRRVIHPEEVRAANLAILAELKDRLTRKLRAEPEGRSES